ncbi:MAG: glycosyltransferase [Haloarculaceae archaeon]
MVIPAYRPNVDRLRSYVDALQAELAPSAVRVELDDPDDEVATELADLPATVNVSPYRRGKGAAITVGFEALGTDLLAFSDADGSTPAASLARVVDRVRAGTDVATGSRRHPDATVAAHQTLARRYMGDGFAWLARRLLEVDLYDYQCGAKALTAAAWERIREHVYEAGFAWDVELLAIAGALELDVAEVPIEWHDQPGSTVSPVRTSLALARALLRARHRAKRIRNSTLHTALASRRDEGPALVDRR